MREGVRQLLEQHDGLLVSVCPEDRSPIPEWLKILL